MPVIMIFFDQCRQVEANTDFRSPGEQLVRRLSLVAKQQGIEQFDVNRADMTQLFIRMSQEKMLQAVLLHLEQWKTL